MPFFGKLTTCPPLPELLARRGKARVAALSVVTAGPARWELRLREVPRPTTAAIVRGIEAAIRESPADVFWFHDRWRTDSRRPLSLFTALDPKVAATATVPLRLLFTAPADATADDLRALVESMAAHRPDLRLDQLVRPGTEPIEHPSIDPHDFDDSLPREQLDGLLERIDAARPGPLDGALCFGGESDLARAARRFGLRCVIGLGVRGKPWTHSYERPRKPEGWRKLADTMAEVPRRRRRRP
jgi:KDO2-lipid IV(A) lauroyltransferase